MRFLANIFLVFFLCGSTLLCYSQTEMVIDNSRSIEDLVVNELIGDNNISVSNITSTTIENTIVKFIGGDGILPLDSGILLTTGNALDVPGLNIGASPVISTSYEESGDSDLASLIGDNNVQDAVILQFDFIANSNGLRFDYIFASEEYPGFICSKNDVMAIFIAGGTEYDEATNIANIPGSTDPVSINTINNRPNLGCVIKDRTNLFNNNYEPVEYRNNFNGFTTSLSAIAKLTPGLQYTIKIAIADVGDAAYDSGLFLKAQSFKAINLPEIDVTEGCSSLQPYQFSINNRESFPGLVVNGWNLGDGSNVLNSTEVVHLYQSPGTYRVEISYEFEDVEFVDFFDVDVVACPTCRPQCISSFSPKQGATYVLSAWVKENVVGMKDTTYSNAGINIQFDGTSFDSTYYGSGQIIDGWQRIEAIIDVPGNARDISVSLTNASGAPDAYFDDIRFHPFNSNMKSFVYDPINLRFMAELDERNYATYYEYDDEGALVRIKKETERGVKTIQESRNNSARQ